MKQQAEVVRQLRRIAENLEALGVAHPEMSFLPFDAEWVRRAASTLEAIDDETLVDRLRKELADVTKQRDIYHSKFVRSAKRVLS